MIIGGIELREDPLIDEASRAELTYSVQGLRRGAAALIHRLPRGPNGAACWRLETASTIDCPMQMDPIHYKSLESACAAVEDWRRAVWATHLPSRRDAPRETRH